MPARVIALSQSQRLQCTYPVGYLPSGRPCRRGAKFKVGQRNAHYACTQHAVGLILRGMKKDAIEGRTNA